MGQPKKRAADAKGSPTPGRESRAVSRWPWPLVAGLFALSGVAALVHQVVWTRWMTLSLGSSSRATVLVLAAFMGGMGIGSWLAGRLADRRPGRALLLFAAAEALIGVWAFLSIPLLSRLLPDWAAALARASGAEGLPLALRATLALATLLLPTLLMGATLPLLGRWTLRVGGLPGRGVGILYTLNTLGGAAGALLAPFVLVEHLGLALSVGVAASLNLAVALAALLLARGRAAASSLPEPQPDPQPDSDKTLPALPGALAAAGVGFFVSGFVGLALEVVTHRVMAVLAGSSVYAFSVMLGAFLIGIAGGSLLALFIADRTRVPGAWLGLGLAGLALGIGMAHRLFESGLWQTAARAGYTRDALSLWSYRFELAGLLLILLPATLMLGFVVPFVARLASAVPARFGRRFGLVYALNTFGAVLGAVSAGAWLVPRLGTARTLSALVVLALAASLFVLARGVPRGARTRALVAASLLGLAGLAAGYGADPVRRFLLARVEHASVLSFEEGRVQTVAVLREDDDQRLSYLRMVTNQTSLTGTHLYARRYMSLLGHLPAIFGNEARRAHVICLGTGMTAAAVAAYPGVERLDIAEISPAVATVAPLFREASEAVLEDPRVRLHLEDGRHILLAGREPWDLITLEPPPPRDSGVVSLYSTDFYELCRARLSPGGVVAQWIPLHSQSLDEIRMLVRSFVEVFPHALGFLPVERELILLGSDLPLTLSEAALAERMAHEGVRRSLARVGLAEPEALLATALLDREGLLRLAEGAPPVSDDRPRVEYFASYGRRPAPPPVSELAAAPLPVERLVDGPVSPEFRQRFERARRALLAALGSVWAFEEGRPAEGKQLILGALLLRPGDPYLLWAAGLSDEHLERLRRRAEARAGDRRVWQALGEALRHRNRVEESVAAYRRALALEPNDVETLLPLGVILAESTSQRAEGRAYLVRVLEIAPTHPRAPVIRQLLASLDSAVAP